MIAGPFPFQFLRQRFDLRKRFAQRSGGFIELRLAEFAVGAGYGLEALDGLAGDVLVGRASLLVALGGRGAGDGVEVRTGLLATGPFADAETGEVRGDAEGRGEEEEENGGERHEADSPGRVRQNLTPWRVWRRVKAAHLTRRFSGPAGSVAAAEREVFGERCSRLPRPGPPRRGKRASLRRSSGVRRSLRRQRRRTRGGLLGAGDVLRKVASWCIIVVHAPTRVKCEDSGSRCRGPTQRREPGAHALFCSASEAASDFLPLVWRAVNGFAALSGRDAGRRPALRAVRFPRCGPPAHAGSVRWSLPAHRRRRWRGRRRRGRSSRRDDGRRS